MFRAVFVLLTCAAVLWHALVGCCAHHEHSASESTACLSPCCGCGQSAESPASDSLESGQDFAVPNCSAACDSKDECDGGRCAFVAPGSSGDTPLKAVDVDWSDLYAAFSSPRELTPSLSFTVSNESKPLLRGDLRRHLALGVLRI
jgi:hypothetical protein